jgi:hypothetical protein
VAIMLERSVVSEVNDIKDGKFYFKIGISSVSKSNGNDRVFRHDTCFASAIELRASLLLSPSWSLSLVLLPIIYRVHVLAHSGRSLVFVSCSFGSIFLSCVCLRLLLALTSIQSLRRKAHSRM